METIFFPSCNFTKASPKTAIKLRNYFKERMPVAGCCFYDKKEYTQEDVGLVLCQACRQQIEPKIKVKTIWEYFDEDETFPLPNYNHMTMGFQDCFRDKEYPEVHQAVRNLIKKMNIDLVEIEDNKEKSVFCGTLHFTPKRQKNIELLKQYPDTKISKLPEEIQIQLMAEQVEKFPKDIHIITDCNRCTKGIKMGGGKAIHLLELIMGEDINL